ncbi:hypothetical protein RhiirA5_438709 [Rhizophagus irregularis]|uniref:Uncharacterized protein n=1 Tax=Rhizophagus irregularis TaxID=588596 RepID=A0A2N0NIT0_9GLOM|nr:hypothetical protein RhiirA5_438709 [Rhizophagus irregularis]
MGLPLETHNIEDEDEALHYCINDMHIRINIMGMVADSNEAVCCKINCHNERKTISNYWLHSDRVAWSWCKSISYMSEIEYNISLTKAITKEKNEAELCKSVKQMMEVNRLLLRLLKDRVYAEKEPKNKKARVQEYLKKE